MILLKKQVWVAILSGNKEGLDRSELVKIHGKSFDKKMQNQFLSDAKELIKDKYQKPITSADEIKIDMYPELRELALLRLWILHFFE